MHPCILFSMDTAYRRGAFGRIFLRLIDPMIGFSYGLAVLFPAVCHSKNL